MIEPIASAGVPPLQTPSTGAGQPQALAAQSSPSLSPASQEGSFATALQAASEASEAAAEAGMQPEPMPAAEVEPMPSAEAEAIPGAEVEGMSQSGGTLAATAYSGTAAYSSGAAPAQALPASYPSAVAQTSATSSPIAMPALPAAEPQPTSAAGGGSAPYETLIQQAAARNGVEPALLKGLIEQESGFDPSAHSSAGALGLTQLMPSTAASLGVSEPLNPVQSIEGGARLLGQLLRQFGGNVSYALAAYNAGAGAVQRYGGVPPYPETEAYVAKVLANAQSYR